MSVGPVIPPSGGVGGVVGAGGSPQAGAGAAPPAAPAAAPGAVAVPSGLSAVISEDLAAQDSLAPLLADLSAALQSGGVPASARTTVQQILQLLTPLDASVTGQSLRAAVAQSGLFLEAGLAATAQAPNDPGAALLLASDLKALLLRLPVDLAGQSEIAAQALAAEILAPDPAARRTNPRPPPPVAGGPTAGQPAAAASIGAGTDAGAQRQTLSHEAHAALARLELMQLASAAKPGAPPRWAFELPMASPTGAGAGMAQFEISRDAPQGGHTGTDLEPVWRARFSLHLDAAGPVHAEVALHSGRTRVTLWAEGEPLRAGLAAGHAELTAALAGPEGGDAAVRVVSGAPPRPEAQAGQLVNRTS